MLPLVCDLIAMALTHHLHKLSSTATACRHNALIGAGVVTGPLTSALGPLHLDNLLQSSRNREVIGLPKALVTNVLGTNSRTDFPGDKAGRGPRDSCHTRATHGEQRQSAAATHGQPVTFTSDNSPAGQNAMHLPNFQATGGRAGVP